MVLKRINRLGSSSRDDSRSSSTGSLQSLYEYQRKKQLVRPPGLVERGTDGGGSQRFEGLIEDYLAKSSSERRSNSVRNLRNIFDTDGSRPSPQGGDRLPAGVPSPAALRPCLSTSKLRKGLGDPSEEEVEEAFSRNNIANEIFSLATSSQHQKKSPEVAVLQKRLAESQAKLRHQEARHIQERLTWKGQTVELQRLRRERDQLLEDQANQRHQLIGTHDIAEAVMAENKKLRAECHALEPELANQDTTLVDWEKRLLVISHESIEKDRTIGCLAAQLEEKNMQLQQETDINTEFFIQLQASEHKLRRQSSNKDLKISILTAERDEMAQQLHKETDLNTEIVSELREAESKLRMETSQKDLAIGRLMEELNESRAGLLQMQSSQHGLGLHQSQNTLTFENLIVDLNDSQGSIHLEDLIQKSGDLAITTPKPARGATRMDPKTIERLLEAQDKLKNELDKAKSNTLQTMKKVRTKLVEERTKIKRDRKEFQDLKRTVVKESVQAVAVISGLRSLIERMQGRIITLEQENKELNSVKQ